MISGHRVGSFQLRRFGMAASILALAAIDANISDPAIANDAMADPGGEADLWLIGSRYAEAETFGASCQRMLACQAIRHGPTSPDPSLRWDDERVDSGMAAFSPKTFNAACLPLVRILAMDRTFIQPLCWHDINRCPQRYGIEAHGLVAPRIGHAILHRSGM